MIESQSRLLLESMGEGLHRIRERHPLVHNITNFVVMNFTANALLAVGASPIMAHAPEEMEEMVQLAHALVLNIGTLSAPWVESMRQALGVARQRSVPVVFDPVGVGATSFRTATARSLIAEGKLAVIRGNASEILTLAGEGVQSRGVDSLHTTDEAGWAALALAREWGTVVAVTGPEDFVTDGTRSIRICNGHPLLSRVTGTGCVATALTGAFCAVEADAFVGAVSALCALGIAGELAAQSNPGPGSFQARLLDALDALTRETLMERACMSLLHGFDE